MNITGWAFLGLLTDGGDQRRHSLPKIYHTYPTMMKLGTVIPYPKKIQKMYESLETSNKQIWPYQAIYVQIAFWYKIFNSFNFSWVFKDCFNKKVTIWMMSAKTASPGLLKRTVFWNKGYDAIIYAMPILNRVKTLSMWQLEI